MTYSGFRGISDVLNLEYAVKQVGMLQTKNTIIDVLRDVFRRDRHYKYVEDVFGFPKTPSHLGLSPDAGLDDEETTRIYIGSSYRQDVKFNPSIIVRSTGMSYRPISFNQDWLGVDYRKELIMDGYGNKTILNVPDAHTLAGAWDQTIEVKIMAENEADREELNDIVMLCLTASRRRELEYAGIHIRRTRSGGEAEQPYANDYLYTASITLDIRTEWKISIPISNLVERIGVCLTFNTLDTDPPADRLAINEQITMVDTLM